MKTSVDIRPLAPPQVPLTYGDPAMRPVVEAIEWAATTGVSVMVVGEMGSGKKLVARRIHAAGSRAREPYLVVSCRRGCDRPLIGELSSALERARGGTVVLDGIDELPIERQPRLVSMIDDLRSTRTGPRLIVTTRVEPRELLEAKRLRDELYLHLSVYLIRLPPLRERQEDLPAVAQELLAELSGRWDVPRPRLGERALAALRSASWPGNLRQLRNVLERAAARTSDGTLRAEDLALDNYGGGNTSRSLAEIERQAIVRALAEVGGNRRRAAGNLGIGLRTLYDKIKRYRIGRREEPRSPKE